MNLTPAELAFARDIPDPKDQENLMTMMSEAAHDDSLHRDVVTILDSDRLDAINVRVHGIVEHAGEEYTFILEDGNNNGTVLWNWNDDVPFEYHEPTKWTLQPTADLIDKAIVARNGNFLIQKWDIIVARKEWTELIRSYSYDRHFHPGLKIETHYKAKAAAGHFEIVTEETATETRKILEAAN